jgi:choline dehydrogenase-like flavoprotein
VSPRIADPDVVIVGAGAGGLAAAWRLTTEGASVVLLEAGKRYDPIEDYPQTGNDFELHPFPYNPVNDEVGRTRYTFGAAQQIGQEWGSYRSFNAAQGSYAPGGQRRYLQYNHVRGVGGSTLRFQGEVHKLHPESLRTRSLLGVGADWPVSFQELDHYYQLAEERIGIAAPHDNRWRPEFGPSTMPAHPLSYASERLVPAFAEVGATLIPNSLAIPSQPYDGRPPCNYCNSCTYGCMIGDLGTADRTFLPPARKTRRLDLRPNCQVGEILIDAQGRASGVRYVNEKGRTREVKARFVVLAAGGIETPRLLLLSQSGRFPNGLANNHGQVGLHLTESTLWVSVAMLPERVDAHRGVNIDGSAWEFSLPREHDGWVGGFRLATTHGVAGLRGPGHYAARLVPGFGLEHQRKMVQFFGHAVAVMGMGDWLPNSRTRVELDRSYRDALGLPVARITSFLGDNERSLLREMADTVRAVLEAARAVEIVEETSSLDLFNTAHTLGTCRMGKKPADSVADPDGFCHEVPNLAIADGALMPSSGSGDSPCLTISALAIRTADKILRRAKGGLRS